MYIYMGGGYMNIDTCAYSREREREMEEYFRRCERMEGMSAMMVGYGGGDRALRTTMAAFELTSFSSSSKHEIPVYMREFGDLNVNLSRNSASPADSTAFVRAPSTSKCSSARRKSREVVKDIFTSLDLQDEDIETDNSAYVVGSFSRETSPTSEIRGEAVTIMEAESTSAAKKKSTEANRRRREKPPAGKKPPAAEIDEFFAVAEKYEQKRFLEKYNYDVVKDEPLEGRYEWVRLNNP